jgi:hypothetical protein
MLEMRKSYFFFVVTIINEDTNFFDFRENI